MWQKNIQNVTKIVTAGQTEQTLVTTISKQYSVLSKLLAFQSVQSTSCHCNPFSPRVNYEDM